MRVNALSTLDGFRDVVALAESAARPAFLMVPKPCGADELLNLRAALGEKAPPLWPLIETPEALLALPAIARAVGDAGGLMFGGADYSASLGADMSWDALYHVRASIVSAAALVGCEAVDVPFLDVKDEQALLAETRRVKAMGFTGRAAIHPAQIAAINEVFAPTPDELSKAEKIRAAYDAAAGGVALLDGKLIEKPVLRAAERVLSSKGTK
jgi:citrate lyase subunit beta/citryl-CoA lyase/(S)-citramalyl-CoA lyase